jgi:hypothetical protein
MSVQENKKSFNLAFMKEHYLKLQERTRKERDISYVPSNFFGPRAPLFPKASKGLRELNELISPLAGCSFLHLSNI